MILKKGDGGTWAVKISSMQKVGYVVGRRVRILETLSGHGDVATRIGYLKRLSRKTAG